MVLVNRERKVHPVWIRIQGPNRKIGAQSERESLKDKVFLASERSSIK
jgi:hypothetical protein